MGSGCLKPTCYGHQILDQIARNLWKIFLKIDSATISNWKILIKRKQKKFQTKVRVVTTTLNIWEGSLYGWSPVQLVQMLCVQNQLTFSKPVKKVTSCTALLQPTTSCSMVVELWSPRSPSTSLIRVQISQKFAVFNLKSVWIKQNKYLINLTKYNARSSKSSKLEEASFMILHKFRRGDQLV